MLVIASVKLYKKCQLFQYRSFTYYIECNTLQHCSTFLCDIKKLLQIHGTSVILIDAAVLCENIIKVANIALITL